MPIHEPEAGPTWAERAELSQLASVLDPTGQEAKNILIDRVQKRALDPVVRRDRGARALDFGCGTGRLTGWLADRGLEVEGVDASPEMILAAQRFLPNIRFAVADDRRLPYEAGVFDVVFSVGVLQYFTKTADGLVGALAELRRVATRDGGRVVVIEQAHDGGLGRGTSVDGYLESFADAGLARVEAVPIRRSDCRAAAFVPRFPLLARAPGLPQAILRDARRRRRVPLTEGRYADVLFVAQT